MPDLLLLLLLVGAVFPAAAQEVRPTPARTWSMDSVLARFERDEGSHAVPSVGAHLTLEILFLPETFAERKDSLLAGLERLVLTSASRDVRASAAGVIAFAGELSGEHKPLPGIVRRLERIYVVQDERDEAGVRHTIRNQLPAQAERRAAAALLRRIAAEPDPHNRGLPPHGYFSYGDPRTEALARLAEMGDEGRAVLQAMHRAGEAKSPQARIVLDDMARRGFPVVDARRPAVPGSR